MSDDLIMNAYLHAIEAERMAWAALDKRLPGRPGFSPPRWSAWVDAVADLKLETERCMAHARSGSSHSHGDDARA
jgi:hypothetical protein